MSEPQIHFLSAAVLAKKIRQRELSPVAITETLLARIDQLDPQLHAYARVFPEQAMAEAKAAEKKLISGAALGPLHGVPVGVKDLCWMAGHPTAAGTTVFSKFMPNDDATVVARLKAAGAIILGKLQLTEGAFATHHPTIAPPVNPWGKDYWPGASSSGSGVATAAGLCFGAIGTDTGGSIRFPSAANGLTGIKPTWGRVSRYGVFDLAPSMDHVGTMGRSAADAALMLAAIAGNDSRDPTSLPDERLDLPSEGLDFRGLRIGIDHDWNTAGVDEDIVIALNEAVKVITAQGGTVVPIHFPSAKKVVENWELNCGVEVAVAHEAFYPRLAAQYGPALSRLLDLGRSSDAMSYQRVLLERARFRGALTKVMHDVDLLLLPVQPYAAPDYQQLGALAEDPEANQRLIQFTAPINASGHPAITLPCGFSKQGMPIAFQFIAAHGAEAVLCRAGMAYQRETAWHEYHPAGY